MSDFHIKTPAQLTAALRALRRAQGLNQSELGRKVGLSQERISAIENHPERMTVNQLLTLLMAAGMELVIKPRSLETSTSGSW
ncbi:MAG TPA: XRE family transcriptional regulator [Steroidobacteraceae bacterium]|jgi:HTH-type transcriptional regulator/antitoxin HipB|nr:XRE family transcriptional regulator [Steroidobacteraceae bacterium]